MPLKDRYRDRELEIEFLPVAEIRSLPRGDRNTLAFLTDGALSGTVNGCGFALRDRTPLR